MNKRFENKSAYDTGRFRHKITFQTLGAIPDGFGGFKAGITAEKDIRAIKFQIKDFDQDAIAAGVTTFNGGTYFVIRKQPDWEPVKNMQISHEGILYNIRAIIPQDDPAHYFKILAQWQI